MQTVDRVNDMPLAFVKAKLLFDSQSQAHDLIVEEANLLFIELVGLSSNKVIGKKLSEFSFDFAEINKNYFGKKDLSFTPENPYGKIDVFITRKQKWYEVFIHCIDKESYSILINDFTDRKIKEHQVLSAQQKFKKLYDNATIGIYQANMDGTILLANKAMEKILGANPEDSNKNGKDAIKIDFSQAIFQKHFKKNTELIGHICQWKTLEGKDIYVRLCARPIRGKDNQLLCIEGTVEDITAENIARDQINSLNAIFTELGVDPYVNIQVIVRKCCELMNGYCALYNRLDKEEEKLFVWAVHNLPEMLGVDIPLHDTLCYDRTIAVPDQVIVFEDLLDSKYMLNDGFIKQNQLRSYLGKSVVFDGKIIGSLCVLGKYPRSFSSTEQKIIETLSIALSHEHKRFELERDYRHARAEAEFANRAKSQFLSNMSHEIRTPLNGILGFSEMLQTQEMNDYKKHMLRLIEESGNQLLHIVNDIFDYSLLDAGKIPLKESTFNLPDLMKNTMRFFEAQADIKEVDLIFDLDGIVNAELYGDYLKLNQILVNLISNAIKFTDEGAVIIRLNTKKKRKLIDIDIIVEDTGIGIGKDQLESIFDEFSQLDYYLTKRIKGTGLGLTITKKLVDLLQGRIFVESEPGKGSRFFVHLPFKIGTPDKNELIMKDSSINQNESSRKIKILLAEDNEANQFLIKAITKSKDWDITVVDDGQQAVEAYKNNTYNLVLMDVQMPVMNGYEATGIIREIEKEKNIHTPIVALTAYAMKSDKDQCIQAGMDDYISKPFKRQEFLDMIENSIEIK